jgi:sensor c-di-GMP phosphodiesterase-like protein
VFLRKPNVTVIAIVVAIVAAATPILIALWQARRQALDGERRHILSYATDVLHRTEATGQQIEDGIARIVESRVGDPCDEANLAVMREIDLASTYIQAIGYVAGDRLICSSLGQHGSGFPLGPVDLVGPNQARIRVGVRFPFAPSISFVVVERDNYAAIIHKDLPIDIQTSEPDASLAIYMLGRVLTSRGNAQASWFESSDTAQERTFIDGEYLVTVVRSNRYAVATAAAIPLTYLNQRVRATALLLVPIGAVMGIVLAFVLVRLTRSQLALPAVLKTALRRREFFLVYEPIVDLKTGAWVGAEALVRWRRPTGETVRPDVFIPVAEDSGLIVRITEQVIDMVGRDAAALNGRFPHFTFSINLSSADLHEPGTLERIDAIGAEPGTLQIEVTERGLLDRTVAMEVIRGLRARHISVAIDDFGTGYSSLSYLRAFDADILKIDKSFVRAIATDSPTSDVVQHIIDMGRGLRFRLIAEGIETDTQLTYLRDRGVHYGQGFFFTQPLALDGLIERLATAAVVDNSATAPA